MDIHYLLAEQRYEKWLKEWDGNCTRCKKPIEEEGRFLCQECVNFYSFQGFAD